MKSGAAPAAAPDPAINNSECADRILKAVQERANAAASEWQTERLRLIERIANTERTLETVLAACKERREEYIRVRSDLEQIEKALADPPADLGTEIRLKRDRGELQAYLKGLGYAVGPAKA